ncbi:hypothetical protein JHK82_013201 [Glycine max]|uniref:Uncharacterized protein n=1 Tax=Glycine max TaxID=3847 RepID=K7KQQ1_SOYBN|nr:hypothetical protein JHK82_013201 [Glycine max]KAH1134848.1 hypothetical protein GYH30_012926 [Glycine max]KRH59184.1 hypothetical protein GLYMA_05G169800v4 [Glycine max]
MHAYAPSFYKSHSYFFLIIYSKPTHNLFFKSQPDRISKFPYAFSLLYIASRVSQRPDSIAILAFCPPPLILNGLF